MQGCLTKLSFLERRSMMQHLGHREAERLIKYQMEVFRQTEQRTEARSERTGEGVQGGVFIRGQIRVTQKVWTEASRCR